MPNIDDDIRKSGKRLKALRKTTSAHNKANRIFVYKRDGGDVSEDALKSKMRSKGLSTESRAAQLRIMVRTAENKAAAPSVKRRGSPLQQEHKQGLAC